MGVIEARAGGRKAVPSRRTSKSIACGTSERGLKHFMIPYNQKIWGVQPREITAAWCSRSCRCRIWSRWWRARWGLDRRRWATTRRPLPEVGRHRGLHAGAGHPAGRAGERGTRSDADQPGGGGRRRREVRVGGESLRYRALVATIPLPELLRRMSESPRPSRRRPAFALHDVARPEDRGARATTGGLALDLRAEKRYPFYR